MRHDEAMAARPQMQSCQLNQRTAVAPGGQGELFVSPFEKFLMIFSAFSMLQLPPHGRKCAVCGDDPAWACLYALAGHVEFKMPRFLIRPYEPVRELALYRRITRRLFQQHAIKLVTVNRMKNLSATVSVWLEAHGAA